MATYAEFGEATTASEVARAFGKEIYGKSVLITGVSPTSLGDSLAFSIASQKPALLILASRTESKIEVVAAKIRHAFPDILVQVVLVDFSSQASVRQAAGKVNNMNNRLHVLINNAGLMVPEHRYTTEGIELQFGTNHIGPFLFTNLLMEKIRKGASESAFGTTRVVNVSSSGHSICPVRFSDYNFQGNEIPPEEKPPPGLPGILFKPGPVYGGFLSYGQSKTANILMSVYLTTRLRREGIISYSVHPGTIQTNISRHLDQRTARAVGAIDTFWKSPDQGAATILVAAFDPTLSRSSGIYLSDCQFAEAAAFATDKKLADRLWHLSEDLVGQRFDLGSQSRL